MKTLEERTKFIKRVAGHIFCAKCGLDVTDAIKGTLRIQTEEIFKEMHRILGKRVFHWNDYYAMKKRFLK